MQSIEEVVLIGVDETALQAKLVLPETIERFAMLLHAPGGGRHDRAMKAVAKTLEGSHTGFLIPDLTDETEGWHGIKDEPFLIERALKTLAWFLNRSGAESVTVYAEGGSESFARALLEHPGVARVLLGEGENIGICAREGCRRNNWSRSELLQAFTQAR